MAQSRERRRIQTSILEEEKEEGTMAMMLNKMMGILMLWAMVMMAIDQLAVDAATSRPDPQTTQYVMQTTVAGKERARCLARNKCYLKVLTCPSQCPKRVAGKRSCFIDCSTKCQTTCKSNYIAFQHLKSSHI